jgi:hypothetical protein
MITAESSYISYNMRGL